MQEKLSEEELKRRAKVYLENNRSINKTAKIIKRSRSATKKSLVKAAKLGFIPPVETQIVLPGFEISSIATQERDGEIKSTTIRQVQEAPSDFIIPEGYNLSAGTYQVRGSDNKVERFWPRIRPGEFDPKFIVGTVKELFSDWKPTVPNIITPKEVYENQLTVYPITDWHMGLEAVKEETGDADWNLDIATEVLSYNIAKLIDRSPPSKYCVFLGLGDLAHADNYSNVTPKNKNPLDVHGRYYKTVAVARDILANSVVKVASKHQDIDVQFKDGNHDPVSTVAFRYALWGLFHTHGRIHVDESPSHYYWRKFGVNLIGGTHGHNTKPEELPMVMAARQKENWGTTSTRHIHTGHRHTGGKVKNEINGVVVWMHRAPIPKEAYAAQNPRHSGRSLGAYFYDYNEGYIGHNEVEIR